MEDILKVVIIGNRYTCHSMHIKFPVFINGEDIIDMYFPIWTPHFSPCKKVGETRIRQLLIDNIIFFKTVVTYARFEVEINMSPLKNMFSNPDIVLGQTWVNVTDLRHLLSVPVEDILSLKESRSTIESRNIRIIWSNYGRLL